MILQFTVAPPPEAFQLDWLGLDWAPSGAEWSGAHCAEFGHVIEGVCSVEAMNQAAPN